MADPTDLLVEGDDCDSCSKQWAKQGQPPRKLIALNRRTGNKSYSVVICPYCDGQPILDFQPLSEEPQSELPPAMPNRRLRPDGSYEPYESQTDDGATAEEV